MQVLTARTSDHKPLLTNFSKEKEERVFFQMGFKFEASWLLDDEYHNIIQEAGEGGVHLATNSPTKAFSLSNEHDIVEPKEVWAC